MKAAGGDGLDGLTAPRESGRIRRVACASNGIRRRHERGLAMGIFDSLENSPGLKGALGQLGAAVLPVVLSEIMGTGSQGGLNGIVAKLEQAGFGEQVKSWIGTGQNLPITADQLRQVLGNDTVPQNPAKKNIPIY